MQQDTIFNRHSKRKPTNIEENLDIWLTLHEKKLLSSKPDGSGGSAPPPRLGFSEPQHLPADWIYENIKDAIYHCRRIFYIYLGFLAYTLLTIITSQSLDFFKARQQIKMPFLGTTVPLEHYLILAPLLLIGFFIYKQLYLYKTNKLIKYAVDKCRSLNGDTCTACRPQAKSCSLTNMCDHQLSRLYPWIIIYCRFSQNRALKEVSKDSINKLVGKAQQIFVSFSLWWLLPIILILLSGFVIKKHGTVLSLYMIVVFCFGSAVVEFFWYLQQKLMGRAGTIYSSIRSFLIFGTMAFLLMLLVLLNVIAFTGNREWPDYWWPNFEKNPLITSVIHHIVFIDIRNQAVVKKPEHDRPHWIDLEKRNFEGADLSGAKLTKANLRSSRLNHAKLAKTDLTGADLHSAEAMEVDFSVAILTGATLNSANLAESKFLDAQLKEANISYATLEGTDFTFANLSGADFRSSKVYNTIFLGADVQYANLRQVKKMEPSQIKKASSYQLAYYSPKWFAKLGLKSDHNVRVKSRRFSQYCFDDANLEEADLHGADLTGAGFRDATLKRADLRDAKLEGADLNQANFQEADLRGISYTDAEQLAKVKTFYKAIMDDKLKKELLNRYPKLFDKPLEVKMVIAEKQREIRR